MAFYGSGTLYGSGAFYLGGGTTPSQAVPVNLRFYRTSQDGVYVFWWTFDPAFITPALASTGFDLELDTSPLFDSPNLVIFTQDTAITFQNGNVAKGFAVPVAARINDVTQTWYARVRTHTLSFTSDWSATLTWTIPQSWQQQTAEALMESLPDYHVYGKGDLLKPVEQRNTNLWVVENMYGNQFDAAYYETFLTKTDNYIALCRDEFLYQNFGILFNYPKPNVQTFVEYRNTLEQLILGSLNGSTLEPVLGVVQSFAGVPPLIQNIRDLNDFFLNLIMQGTPNSNAGVPYLTTPDGVMTAFTVAYEFIIGSMALFKNGNRLVKGTDYVEDDALPGFVMTVPPLSSDVLNVFYQIGNPGDPRPVLFDPTVATPITGTITYTNGSIDVVGTGTMFTTQLINGSVLIDTTSGYYATVFSIASDTNLKLVDAWGGPTETVAANKAPYNITPLVLWDKATLAFGVIITVQNPADFDIDLALIESLVNPLLSAQVKVFWQLAS